MSRSTRFKAAANALDGAAPLILLEIIHPSLPQPVRVVNDVQDVASKGNVYTACPFRVAFPDDSDGKYPEAKLQIDNIGRELTYWLENSQGGAGAQCRLIQILRDYPDDWEADYLLDMRSIGVDQLVVTASLSYKNVFDLPAVGIQYRAEVLPELH